MAILDWCIIGFYVVCALCIGVYFSKRASRSADDFFVAGRTLPWFIAGTSIVATTFSADTPLFIAGMSRTEGIFSNWFWWSAAIGQVATVFFFARLWRRSNITTDIEFIAVRYKKNKARDILRIFNVFFFGVFINCTIMASVTLAMAKILKVLLNFSDDPLFTMPIFGDITPTAALMVLLGTAVVIYTTLSGLYGVAYLDFVQFAMAMIGSIGLAVIVYIDASKNGGVIQKLATAPRYEELTSFFPDLSKMNIATFTFLVYILIIWWSQAPGNGYLVQRMLATKSESHAFFAFLWYNICHYVIRPWPWIIVGMLSLFYFPNLSDPEMAFPSMIDRFLPVGLKGVMVASMFAAFMSTLDTQLNWGTSYLVNDLYKPYIKKDASPKHYVKVSRICMLLLTATALIVTTKLSSILGAYKYLFVSLSGIGSVLIIRWYWWRVNAYSEIAAMATTLIMVNILHFWPVTAGKDMYAARITIISIAVTVVWLVVTFLTSKKPDQHTVNFYKKMRITGPGWKKIREATGIKQHKGEFLQNFIGWITCVVFLYSILIGVGKLLFHEWMIAIIYFIISIISGWMLKKCIGKMIFE